jgi:hypothetical protein
MELLLPWMRLDEYKLCLDALSPIAVKKVSKSMLGVKV